MLINSDYRDWYLQVPSPPDQKPLFSSQPSEKQQLWKQNFHWDKNAHRQQNAGDITNGCPAELEELLEKGLLFFGSLGSVQVYKPWINLLKWGLLFHLWKRHLVNASVNSGAGPWAVKRLPSFGGSLLVFGQRHNSVQTNLRWHSVLCLAWECETLGLSTWSSPH